MLRLLFNARAMPWLEALFYVKANITANLVLKQRGKNKKIAQEVSKYMRTVFLGVTKEHLIYEGGLKLI